MPWQLWNLDKMRNAVKPHSSPILPPPPSPHLNVSIGAYGGGGSGGNGAIMWPVGGPYNSNVVITVEILEASNGYIVKELGPNTAQSTVIATTADDIAKAVVELLGRKRMMESL